MWIRRAFLISFYTLSLGGLVWFEFAIASKQRWSFSKVLYQQDSQICQFCTRKRENRDIFCKKMKMENVLLSIVSFCAIMLSWIRQITQFYTSADRDARDKFHDGFKAIHSLTRAWELFGQSLNLTCLQLVQAVSMTKALNTQVRVWKWFFSKLDLLDLLHDQVLFIFSGTEQLHRWPCHSLTQWVSAL